MVPESLSLFLVALSGRHRAAVRDALPLAFGGRSTELVTLNALEDAFAARGSGLLLLDGPTGAEVARALEAVDESGLPRCTVVAFGSDELFQPGVETLGDEEADPRFVARALRSAAAALDLRRRLGRECGDVWTLGRRVTHDVRNPLGCIVTTAEMLKEVLTDDAPQHIPMVETIVDSTGEILELLNRVHLVAKASAQPRPAERFDMGAAHQAAVDRLQREITRRKAVLESPEDWPEVQAVRPWVEIIWADLIANALRHGGDPVTIHTGWRAQAGSLTFWVENTGPSVPPERVPLLFTPFHRLHLRHGGGLGLSIVQRLVDLQQGRCAYEPRNGGGAVFSFTLPMVDPGAGGQSSASPSNPVRASARRLEEDGLTASPSPAG